MRAVALILLGGMLLPAVVAVQNAPPLPAVPSAPLPLEHDAYQSDGRRDLFLSLLGAGAPPAVAARRSAGPAGIAVDELSVRGILQSQGRLIALIQGPDKATHVVRSGEQLLDGVIKTVTPEGLVIVQEVSPLPLGKLREVTKALRSQEDAKQ
jgi:Tfp pilus assembly protein PilP